MVEGFDEFHVSDIADAMILYNLMQALFNRGVCFVITSNYPPDGLYPDGLHRDRMLPAIDLLKSKLDILNVDAGIDYRRRVMEQVEAYRMPLGPAADSALLHKKGVRFDPRFQFHFYDLDFCRSAQAARLRLGTWPIALSHASHGTSIQSKAWERSRALYFQKWQS